MICTGATAVIRESASRFALSSAVKVNAASPGAGSRVT